MQKSNGPFTVKHESGNDYAIVDRNGIVRVSGLFEEEAEQTAEEWNRLDEQDEQQYSMTEKDDLSS